MPPKRKASSKKAPKNGPTTTVKTRRGKQKKEPTPEPAEEVNYDAMKLAELKKACEEKGLETKGKKADLIERLKGAGADDEDAGPPPKMKKVDVDSKIKQAMKDIQAEGPKKRRNYKVDDNCPISAHVEVCEDYDCMLNQTDIGFNNNKYYVIQLLQSKNSTSPLYWTWNRWGRVGELGSNSLRPFGTNQSLAIADFEKKFRDKTRNDWAKRNEFTAYPKKYTLLEMDDEDENDDEDQPDAAAAKTSANQKTKPCTLDPAIQELMELIFDSDMFANAMKSMNIDVKKMPLGKLSKQQIAKGFDVLVELEDAIKAKKGRKAYEAICSKFYTLVPHDFKRTRPEVISSLERVQEKKDMLIVLSDIEVAQGLKKEQEKKEASEQESQELPPHPLDVKYQMLGCELKKLDPKDDMFKVIEKYKKATNEGMKLPILNVYEMKRPGEVLRFEQYDSLENRKLLWHGTNIAVVAAILNGGLRIMPHSGGRVGRGIYFASENQKSAAYVGPSGGWGLWGVPPSSTPKKNVGIMFLAEVALGKEKTITKDDCSLTKPPSGFHSVIARGETEPDPKENIAKPLDGKTVVIPQGKPIPTEFRNNTTFSQSEYLVYDEAQVRLRYLLELDYNNPY